MVCSSGQWAINLKSILQKKTLLGVFLYQPEVGCAFFLSFSPLLYISFHFCGSLADWSECCYGMCCGTKEAEIQKLTDLLERPHLLSPFVHSLPVFVSYSLSSPPPSLLLYRSFSHSFSVSALIYFDAGSGTSAWPFLHSLSRAHTNTKLYS